MKKKKDDLEKLKNDYYNTTHTPAKKLLLGLIKLKEPNFKGDKDEADNSKKSKRSS